ncbi:DUF6477 family protein [Rhodalgimonas zhirmunskyi]|uniref:DUF6477 family protein n=1 Tax=Rhodalgimonas zhirmunskyi TaxID=2964767 RepID=A0AAJ1X305_9RHOB|nr:DUF6477 family protein [Rhodoalgimonas zhirmunskyi]MDQ2092843.1 DUF6477 family protein [Rhodoalgimonas zhirmunskyi]
MTDLFEMLETLRRPRLLIRAARAGAEDYTRTPHLRRLLGTGEPPRTGEALMHLMEMERDIDIIRRAGDPGYSAVRHVDLLIAMMGEAALLRASRSMTPTLC